MENEKYLPVLGYEGHYEVSNLGNIRSLDRTTKNWTKASKIARSKKIHYKRKGRDIKSCPCNKYGHQLVSLSRDGRAKTYAVHQLVLEAFVGKAPKGQECRHLDGNPRNNKLDNLAWGTHKENIEDMVRHGTKQLGEDCPSSVLTVKQVIKIRAMLAQGIIHREIADGYGVHRSLISHIKAGRIWSHV